MMGRIGAALFGVGIVGGIVTAAPVPAKMGDWPHTTTLWIVFAIIGAIGTAMWRVGVKRKAREELKTATADQNPFALLESMQAPAQKLLADVNGLTTDDLMARVDELLDGFVLPFAEVRSKVIDRLGMTAGSEILVTLAYGERMLNRTWSASSDDHLPEARASLPEAVAAIGEAQRVAAELIAANPE